MTDAATPSLPLSVLDLAAVSDGQTTADALGDTTRVAQHAEQLGYTRIWVAEHHNMATVASTVPAVLMAHLAANTESIKVGSGGVMLPNHAPLSIAEQFSLIEALHPGRVDLGIGRAPGTDGATALALRGARHTAAEGNSEDFPRNLIDLMGLLGDVRAESGLWDRFRATPVADSYPSIVLLGSSDFSAQLAGILGLPFGFAHHFDMGGTVHACSVYRDSFKPSVILDEPYTIVTASTLAASTTEQAEWLAGPGLLRKLGIRTGHRLPLMSPADAAAHPQFGAAQAMPVQSLVGTPAEVVAGMQDLAQRTGASELMLYTSTYGLDERLTSLQLIAEEWAAS